MDLTVSDGCGMVKISLAFYYPISVSNGEALVYPSDFDSRSAGNGAARSREKYLRITLVINGAKVLSVAATRVLVRQWQTIQFIP